ncbi:hypothetical protein HHI36_001601 [Cryptolaemus montrouzieri]|uniref:Uncharacterized protein n=1 Tax=Cryptolaemus montrouzieri TaxID=559131 RepID=A0ABD2P9F1_9CUCU
MSKRTRKLVRLALEILNEEIDEVKCPSASNDHKMPALSTQVTNIPPSTTHHDPSNGTLATPATMILKELDSAEHCTTSDESDDVVSSGSSEMYAPSTSESLSSNSSPSPPSTSNTNNNA